MSNLFKKEDYESSDGMLTSVWGPMFWQTLHIISFNYPVKPTGADKKHYMDYILSLQYILPCKYCRDNLKDNLKKTGFSIKSMESRDTFSKYIYKLHNHVNRMLGKSVNIKYTEVRDRYEHFRARCIGETPLIPKHTGVKENGCIESLYGQKAKCVIHLVPATSEQESFVVDPKCQIKRKSKNKAKRKK